MHGTVQGSEDILIAQCIAQRQAVFFSPSWLAVLGRAAKREDTDGDEWAYRLGP